MNTIKRKAVSGFLSATMIFSAFAGLAPISFAEEYDNYGEISLLSDETLEEVYKFDASTFTPSGTAINASDYGITPASTSSTIWGTIPENSANNTFNETGIRYTTRTAVSNAGLIMQHVFANDSTNSPSAAINGKRYSVEHIFTPLVRSGYMYIDINSADGPIARLRIDGANGAGAKTNAYIADADGNATGDKKLNFQICSSSSAGNPGSILYLKTEINNETKTYSAWLKVAKSSATGALDTSVSDGDLLVSDQPFIINTTDSITGMSYNLQNSTADTQGIWQHKTVVSKLPDTVVPVETPEPTETPAPTEAPTSELSVTYDNSKTAAEYGWSTEKSANGTMEATADGILFTKSSTSYNSDADIYDATVEFPRYEVAENTYGVAADGHCTVEFDAVFNPNHTGGEGVYIDFIGSGGSSDSPAANTSLGRIRFLGNGNFTAYSNQDVTLKSSMNKNQTYNIKADYNLPQKNFDLYIDGVKTNTTPLRATNWGDRQATILLDHLYIFLSRGLNADSTLTIKNLKVTQYGERKESNAQKAATALTGIATDADNVTSDITLPSSVESFENVTVSWTSSDTDVISNTGTVTRADEDKNITMTAKLTDSENYVIYKEFEVTVPAAEAAPSPTITADPSDTPAPTETTKPDDTPLPTETPKPTNTPKPTATVTPKPTDAPSVTLPPVSGTVIMNEDYTSKTPAEYYWAVTDNALASNGTLSTDTNGLSITKTAAKTSVYTVTGSFSKYMTSSDSNSKTYINSADDQAAVEFDAKFDIASDSNTGGAIYLDIMGSGIASGSTDSALISLGRLRIKPDGSANAYAASGVNGSSSDYVLSTGFTGAWHNIRFVYDLSQKTYNIFIDGTQANSEPLKATDWRERSSAILLNGFKVEMQQLAPNSRLSIKNVKVTQVSAHTPSYAENAAASIASIAADQTNVTEDLTLPSSISGFDKATVEWSSSNTSAVTADGKVTRSLENQSAVLTAKIVDENKYTVYKEFPVTIPKVDNINSAEMILNRAKAYMETYRVTNENYNDITTDLKQLITSWHDDSSNKDVTIAWTSSAPTVISNDGKYLAGEKPTETSTVVMTATLSVEGKNTEVKYTLTVNKYTEEKLILSADLTDISPWKYFDKSDAVNSFDNVSTASSNGKFVITKNSVANEPSNDFSERYRSMYSFRQYIEQYNDTTRTATYSQGLNGQFKIVSNATHHVTSGSQFQVENIATGNDTVTAKYPFALAINSSKVYNYNDQNNPVFSGNVTDKATDFIYTINTETGEYSVRIGENEAYTTTVDPGTLQGIIYTIKSQAKVGDSITVNSIDVYSLNGSLVPNPLVETAEKLTMASITDTPTAIEKNLNLPASIDGAEISWTSSDTKLIANDGSLGSAPLDSDKNVVLTAAISKGSDTIYKEFHVVVPKESDPETIIKKDMSLINISKLTQESTDNISKDLTLPKTGTYGSTITWKSSNTEYITDDGKVVKLGGKTSPEVIMTASFSYGGKTLTKEFKFNMAINFEEGLFTVYETNTIGNALTSNITAVNGTGKIFASDGKIILDRTEGNGSGDATSVAIKPVFEGKEIAMSREFVLDVDITIPNANTKFEIIPKDANGNRITTIYSGNEGGTKPYFTYVTSDSTGEAQHIKEYYTASGSSTNLKFKFHVKPEDGTFTLQYSLNGVAYKSLSYSGSATMKMREAASSLSYFEINAPYNTNDKINNNGTITVNNAAVSTNKALILKMALDQINYTAPLTSTNGYVSENVNLAVNGFPGTTYSWTSSNPSILSNDGVINKANLKENTDVTMTFRLKLNADEEVFYTETIPVTVVYIDPFNLSNGKKATPNVTANVNHGADKAIDGLFTTSWETMKLNENPNITIDLGEIETFSAVILSEAQILGKYNTQGFTIETSTDNKKWTTVYTGQTLGADTQTVKFSPASARYVRYTVTKKNEGNIGLNEIQILVGTTDAEIAKTEGKYLSNKIGSLRGITSSINLPETKYGCTVKYESSIPEYFSDTGIVTRPADKTVTGVLKVTTTYNGVSSTEEIPISIPPTSGGGGGGGGGNGGATPVYKDTASNSDKTSVNSGSLPAFPTDSTFDSIVTAKTVFADVASDFWAYSYIKTLKEKNIVSGDEHGNFNPQNNVSRQEFVKMLISALDISLDSDTQMTFTDISAADWSYKYIRKAVELDIVSGVSDTTFDKTSNITREDMAVMCARALKAANEEVPEKASADFTDTNTISPYALSSVAAIQEMGIINGYEDGSFGPKNNATRSEAARIIYELAK